jgi:hypothetical protein
MVAVPPEDVRDAVARLWAEQPDDWFPPESDLLPAPGLNDLAYDRLILLDADVAGCVSTWTHNDGWLDAERRDVLAACVPGLDLAVQAFPVGESRLYFERLRDAAKLILATSPADR